MILNNSDKGKVYEELRKVLKSGSRFSLISALFSIWGFSEFKEELEKVEQIRLIIPEYFEHEHGKVLKNIVGNEADREFRNRLNIRRVAEECAGWLKKQVEIKSSFSPIDNNLCHISNGGKDELYIHGSVCLTTEGLGLTPPTTHQSNICSKMKADADDMLTTFNTLWSNDDETKEIKEEFLALLEKLYSAKSPQFIYYIMLYNLFQEFIDELGEDKIVKTATGIKDTIIWNKLYKFQRDGVLGAIDKIEKYNGCIIADSVGLGKTFEALAIIKYYELRNDRVLVLCPKKLRDNWTVYTRNDKLNLLASDRFNYDVLNHTDLTRTAGESGIIKLDTLNWGNYDLVVIDESHNFRNNPPRKNGMTRYSRMMKDIIQSGVKTKVLLLSATPVNNRMNDLKNQVAFITEGKDDALYQHQIRSLELTLKRAQTKFNYWMKKAPEERTTDALLNTLDMDYFKLLDLLTIARSRKHIEKYYELSEIGEFPERAAPNNIKADIDTKGQYPPLEEINRKIRSLNLSTYSPLKYVLPAKMDNYSNKYDMKLAGGSIFTQLDREKNLIHLLRVNLFKRMESSINSFTRTIEKLLGKVNALIEKLEVHEVSEIEEYNIEDIDIDDDSFADYMIGSKIKVLIQDIDSVQWERDLKEDKKILVELLRESQQITSARDAKLQALKEIVAEKADNPFNNNNRKMIIFTAFADTAKYLYENIADWAKESKGLYSALVTGAGGNQTTMPGIRRDLTAILSSFSPISKERDKIDDKLTEEIDILIATDCISEGQNLQDCDYLINYDIHWNPVRIIQRFGRVDRLGSRNRQIRLVNFWPNMELEEYINLETRVSGRMKLLDISATGEENIIEEDAGKMNDLEYRRKQLERLKREIVDIDELGSGISISDLTFNDFKMDLGERLKDGVEELERLTMGMNAVVRKDELLDINVGPGVIFCLECVNKRIKTDSSYPFAPLYLIYISDNGETILNFKQTKKILDIVKKLSIGHSTPDEEAINFFNRQTSGGMDMSHYRALLAKAVQAISGQVEEQEVNSLFKAGGTVTNREGFSGVNDFEVLAYLIVLPSKDGISRGR